MEKREELLNKFVSKTKENLENKLEQAQEKRDEIMEQTKTKLKEHVSVDEIHLLFKILSTILLQLEHVEKTRLSNETKLQEIKSQIDEKLKSADEKRDEIISALQEKLRLHVSNVWTLSFNPGFNSFFNSRRNT